MKKFEPKPFSHFLSGKWKAVMAQAEVQINAGWSIESFYPDEGWCFVVMVLRPPKWDNSFRPTPLHVWDGEMWVPAKKI